MTFRRYLLKRLLLTIPVLFGVSVLVFGIIHLLPGDPVILAIGARYQGTNRAEMLRQLHGLNRPIYIQYIDWLQGAITLDFGTSIRANRDVGAAVKSHIMPTYFLAFGSVLLAATIGIPAGIISAANQYTLKDNVTTVFAFLGLSMPNFWLAIILVLVFGLYLGLLPTIGFVSPFDDPVESIKLLILPIISLGTASAAIVTRMMRSSMLEVLSEDYIRAARAKGLSSSVVANKHAVQNALLPTVTVLGLQMGYLLGGAVIVEEIFSIPGLGRLTVGAIFNREYKIIQAAILLIAVTFVVVNLIVDLVYAYLDPRIKYD